jgi:hypothetical protein
MQPRTVRVIYIVPIDAKPWLEARRRATELLEDLQHFFADEMGRHGYGPKTFEIAYDEDGEVLFEKVITSSLDKAQFQAAPRQICQRVLGGGRPRDAPDIEICFFEAYSIVDGNVSCPGVQHMRRRCYLNSLLLKTAIREWLDDDGGYGGRIFPWISSEPMHDGTLSWNRRGPALGDVAGGSFGVIAHELDHAFGGKPKRRWRKRTERPSNG